MLTGAIFISAKDFHMDSSLCISQKNKTTKKLENSNSGSYILISWGKRQPAVHEEKSNLIYPFDALQFHSLRKQPQAKKRLFSQISQDLKDAIRSQNRHPIRLLRNNGIFWQRRTLSESLKHSHVRQRMKAEMHVCYLKRLHNPGLFTQTK